MLEQCTCNPLSGTPPYFVMLVKTSSGAKPSCSRCLCHVVECTKILLSSTCTNLAVKSSVWDAATPHIKQQSLCRLSSNCYLEQNEDAGSLLAITRSLQTSGIYMQKRTSSNEQPITSVPGAWCHDHHDSWCAGHHRKLCKPRKGQQLRGLLHVHLHHAVVSCCLNAHACKILW